MKVKVEMLEKLQKLVFYAAVIGLISSLFIPWVSTRYTTATGALLEMEEYCHVNKLSMWLDYPDVEQITEIIPFISLAEVFFLCAITLSLCVGMGIDLRKFNKTKQSYLFQITTFPLLAFSVLALVFSSWVIKMIYDLEDGYSFSYNFIPLSMSIVMVIGSALLVVLVGRRSLSEVLKERREKKESLAVDVPAEEPAGEFLPPPPSQDEFIPYEEDIPPPDQEVEDMAPDLPVTEQDETGEDHEDTTSYACPNCSAELQGMELICPQCRTNISKRCPSCQRLASFFVEECPQCGFSGE